MKTKLFLAAVAVTFSFAMMSCTGNKTTNAASEGEETTVETVEAVVETDSYKMARLVSIPIPPKRTHFRLSLYTSLSLVKILIN